VIDFRIKSWSAIAPGIDSHVDWLEWLSNPTELSEELDPVSLKQFPPMIRRRFGALGKCAMAAALQIVDEDTRLPCIFASRHGNSELTLELLSGIAASEDMSPTGFSLAVHNAISGLYTIARNDNSPVTSIAAVEGLILHTLIEAAGQLQSAPSVLCVIYDLPLPELVQEYGEYSFPYAIAFVLSRDESDLSLAVTEKDSLTGLHKGHNDPIGFIRFLAGMQSQFDSQINGSSWRLKHKGC